MVIVLELDHNTSKAGHSKKDYLDFMFMVRSLERVGDHATNIAEDTIYIESAEDVRHM